MLTLLLAKFSPIRFTNYTLYNENSNKRHIFQNFLDAKAGDIIIGYESNPVKKIVAIGRISAEQDGEKLFFEKGEGLTTPVDYAALKECPELERMEYFRNSQGRMGSKLLSETLPDKSLQIFQGYMVVLCRL